MKSFERLNTTLNHSEPDRIPFDLSGTTVTGITKKAFIRAMDFRGLSTEYERRETDPIQQIVTPVEATLKLLNSDIRRIGSRRIPDFEQIVKRIGNVLELIDIWGCRWKMDQSKDIYFNQCTYPLAAFSSIVEGLKNFKVPYLVQHAEIIHNDLSEQIQNISDSGVIADRNCAGY
jgi:uroporphyrinogen decarboxylase